MSDLFHVVPGRSAWPLPNAGVKQLEHKLSQSAYTLTPQDRMVIASCLSAYRELVLLGAKERNAVCLELRREQQRRTRRTPHDDALPLIDETPISPRFPDHTQAKEKA